jgi:uncharacterized linocin/CFP29 family protein
MDFIHEGRASGVVAHRLLQSGFKVNALRTNDTLLYDEWKHLDAAVLKAAQARLLGIADLQTRGLTYNIPEGLGKTVIGYQDQSDVEDASISMDGITRGERDRPEYDMNYMPLPIIHKDFSFSAREIQASRQGNMPLDTSMAELAARKVAEQAETLLFQGSGDYTFGGGTIFGYQDFTNRNTVTLGTNWDASAADGATILADVLAMKQASIDDRYFGPWMLYIPTAYETKLDDDFKANSDKSIRQRVLEVSGIQDIKVADFLTANNVILVQMTSDVVRVVEGLPITTVQWDSDGGMKINFKVMTILVPQIRADQTNKCGVIHLAA